MKVEGALACAFAFGCVTLSGLAQADAPYQPPAMCVGSYVGSYTGTVTEGGVCDITSDGVATGRKGVCLPRADCSRLVSCGKADAAVPICPDASTGGYTMQTYTCLRCIENGDAAAGTGGAAGAIGTGGAAGAAGTVALGGAAGAAGTVAAPGGAAGTSGAAGDTTIGGSAGTTGAGGSTAAGGTTLTSSAPLAEDDSGCSLGATSAKNAFGPWLLAGSVPALLFFSRRRRRG